MRLGPPLRRSFFERPCLEVARDLVGCHLVRILADGTRLIGRLVEVEAYLGDGSDPGSHSQCGPTPRNASMFATPGRIYAYRIYGIHTCINLVCEAKGIGAAVLLRAIEPLTEIPTMRAHRGLRVDQSDLWIARGPGRLAVALDLGMEADGETALRGAVSLRKDLSAGPALHGGRIRQSRRIGVNRGGELPYRFFIEGSPWVSPQKMT